MAIVVNKLRPRIALSTHSELAPLYIVYGDRWRAATGGDPNSVPVIDPSWGTLHAELEDPTIELVNEHRASVGSQPVKKSIGCLTFSAEYKSMNMSGYMYMAHDDPAPIARSVGQRIAACGYPAYDAWGENIAYGFVSPEDVMMAFLSDVGHKANIENPLWTTIGVGVAMASNGLLFWTQDFGTADGPVPGSPPPPPPPVPSGNVLTHWMQNVLPLIEADPQYEAWLIAKKNVAEVKRWQAFVTNPHGPIPVMTTPKGKWLVADLALAAAS